jgi:hypothetical protein
MSCVRRRNSGFAHNSATSSNFYGSFCVTLLRDDAGQADEAEHRMIEQRLQDLGYL